MKLLANIYLTFRFVCVPQWNSNNRWRAVHL